MDSRTRNQEAAWAAIFAHMEAVEVESVADYQKLADLKASVVYRTAHIDGDPATIIAVLVNLLTGLFDLADSEGIDTDCLLFAIEHRAKPAEIFNV